MPKNSSLPSMWRCSLRLIWEGRMPRLIFEWTLIVLFCFLRSFQNGARRLYVRRRGWVLRGRRPNDWEAIAESKVIPSLIPQMAILILFMHVEPKINENLFVVNIQRITELVFVLILSRDPSLIYRLVNPVWGGPTDDHPPGSTTSFSVPAHLSLEEKMEADTRSVYRRRWRSWSSISTGGAGDHPVQQVWWPPEGLCLHRVCWPRLHTARHGAWRSAILGDASSR